MSIMCFHAMVNAMVKSMFSMVVGFVVLDPASGCVFVIVCL